MNHQARATGNLERRIHNAERSLFAAVGADVEEFFLDLAPTGLRVRVLSHGHGPGPWAIQIPGNSGRSSSRSTPSASTGGVWAGSRRP
jgi:hypothetical protein